MMDGEKTVFLTLVGFVVWVMLIVLLICAFYDLQGIRTALETIADSVECQECQTCDVTPEPEPKPLVKVVPSAGVMQ